MEQSGLSFEYDVWRNWKPVEGLIQTEEQLEKFIEEVNPKDYLGVDTETTSNDPRIADLVGISFSQNDKYWYIPVTHDTGEPQLDIDYVLEKITPILTSNLPFKVFHNAVYDLEIFHKNGIDVSFPIFDTIIMTFMYDETQRWSELALDDQDRKWGLGVGVQSFKEQRCPIRDMQCVDALKYAGKDALGALELFKFLKPKLDKQNLVGLYDKVEMLLIKVLMRMKRKGFLIDKEYLVELHKTLQEEIKILEDAIYDIVGRKFNIDSKVALADVLVNSGIKLKKRTKDGNLIVSEPILKDFAGRELIDKILEYRTVDKLDSTYVVGILKRLDENNRVHTSLTQFIAKSGRLSSINPNLQNIPARNTDIIRRAFICEEDEVLIAADYDQLEIRILAHMSRDKKLMEICQPGKDIHVQAACNLFKLHPDDVTYKLRRQAKDLQFGIIYGMGVPRLAKTLECEMWEAQELVSEYFKVYKDVKKFIEFSHKELLSKGYTRTLGGRRRRYDIPFLRSCPDRMLESAKRESFNHKIQGSAGELVKKAQIVVDEEMVSGNTIDMLLQVHDEIVISTLATMQEEASKELKYLMENPMKKPLRVPLIVTTGVGRSWAEAK